jgi:hypothetical protein
VPPLVGMAAKVTDVPAQIVNEDVVLMLTTGTTGVDTFITICVALTVTGDAQVNEEVKSHVTLAKLVKVDEVKVAALVPTGEPFTLH